MALRIKFMGKLLLRAQNGTLVARMVLYGMTPNVVRVE